MIFVFLGNLEDSMQDIVPDINSFLLQAQDLLGGVAGFDLMLLIYLPELFLTLRHLQMGGFLGGVR
jgi:hypothetical protein